MSRGLNLLENVNILASEMFICLQRVNYRGECLESVFGPDGVPIRDIPISRESFSDTHLRVDTEGVDQDEEHFLLSVGGDV